MCILNCVYAYDIGAGRFFSGANETSDADEEKSKFKFFFADGQNQVEKLTEALLSAAIQAASGWQSQSIC